MNPPNHSASDKFTLLKQLTLSRKVVIGFAIPIALTSLLAFTVYKNTKSLIETNKWVEHTHQVIAQGHLLEKLILEMETGERGFLITGKDSFLVPFNKAREEWQREIEKTKNLVSDNPPQVEKLVEINNNANTWLEQAANPEINLRRRVTTSSISIDHIETLLENKTGKDILDTIRQAASNLDKQFIAANNQEASKVLASVMKDVVEQETGERGFLITGDEDFLAPYHRGKNQFNRNIGLLKSIILNAPNKTTVNSTIQNIEDLSQQWLNEIAIPEIEMRRQPQVADSEISSTEEPGTVDIKDVEEIFKQGKGKFILDEMRRNFERLLNIYKKADNERAQTLVISLAKSMVDQETGQRGFLITGQEPFLEPFHLGQVAFKEKLQSLKEIANDAYDPVKTLAEVERIETLVNDWDKHAAQREIEDRRAINETGLSALEQLQKFIAPEVSDRHIRGITGILDRLSSTQDASQSLQQKISELEISIRQQQIHFSQYLSTGHTSQMEKLIAEQSNSDKLLIDIAALNQLSTTADKRTLTDQLITRISAWQRNFITANLSKAAKTQKSRDSSLAQIQQVLQEGKGKRLQDEARAIIDDINQDFIKARNIKGSHTAINIAKFLVDQETGERGFIITGDESFLEPYNEGQRNLRLGIAELQNIAGQAFNIDASLEQLSNLENLVNTWLADSAEPEIALRKRVNAGDASFQDIINTLSSGLGKSILDKIRYYQSSLNQTFINAQNQSAQRLLAELEKDIVDMETGKRGYLLSGKPEFLQPYVIGKVDIGKHFLQLRELINQGYDTQAMLDKIDRLRQKAQQWQNEAAEPEILLRRQLDQSGATMADVTRLIESERGKNLIETIQAQIKDFIAVELQLISIRSTEAEAAAQVTLYQTILGAFITMLAAALTGFYLLKTILSSLLKLNVGTQRVAEGDFSQTIEIESNDEIGQLADAFNAMTQNLKDSTESMATSKLLLEEQKEQLTQQKREIEISNQDLITTQEALKQKAEDLEKSSQYKSDFLATMSHEIRTPINGVLGMLGLLIKSEMSDEQHRKAKIAYSSAQSLLNIINDILDFSKVDAGKLELELIDFNIQSLMEELIESMALRAQEKGLEIILNIVDVKHTMVKGDPGRVRQILTNLISNALKFTQEGEIVITASLKSSDDEKLHFNCKVTDTGIGIPADKQHRLFNTFTQVDASTTRKYGGTGLGLSIVKKLCNLMQGDVHVSSAPDEGSCFSFSIELDKSQQAQPKKPVTNISSLKLLLVDDNDTNLDVISSQLEQWGCDVTQAKSASEALAICQRRSDESEEAESSNWTPFDIGLLDYSMPEMDGAELGQELKANPRFRNMKLIMMTSFNTRGDAQYFSDLGFDAYFPKPATPSDLHDALAIVSHGGATLEQAQPLVTRHYVRSLDSTSSLMLEWPESPRILLVEDNQVNQQVAKEMLLDINLDTDIAGNGIEALLALKQAQGNDAYSLVLMDCQMPEMDGYEATKKIRSGKAGEHNRNITIVAMTANAMAGDKEHCLEVGMDDYISKPIDAELLEQVLLKWLNSHTAADSGEVGTTETETETTDTETLDAEKKEEKVTLNKFEINEENKVKALEEQNPSLIAPIEKSAKHYLSQKPIWDQQSVLRRVNNKPNRVVKLATLYIQDMPARLDELKAFVANSNYEETLNTAHAIKGVAGNLSALALQDLAAQLEEAAREENKPLLVNLSNAITTCHHQLVGELERFTSSPQDDAV